MNLTQIISLIRNNPDRGLANRATELTDRTIIAWINEVRGFLVSKDIEKDTSYPVALDQDLGCWPLVQVDQADCLPNGWEWGDNVKKAVFPEILELKNNMGLSFFGLIDKRTRIQVSSSNFGSLDDFKRFPPIKNWNAYMIGNNTIYIKWLGKVIAPTLKTVNIRGAFKDPTLITYYNEVGEKYCYDFDKTEYPIPADLTGVMIDMIWKRYLMPWASAPRDNTNVEKNEAVS